MKRHSPLLALLFSVLFACSSSPKTDSSLGAPGTATGKSSNLTRETAMWRSRQPHKIRYSVWLGLDEESKEFRGRTKVKFELREHAFRKKKKLRLDFTGGNVTTLIVNGNQWTPEKTAEVYNGEWFEFDRGDLSKTSNTIEVAYTHPYSDSGNGLYRFKDPEDGKVYIRSDNEPYYANLIFPCFDQPDLKAVFDVTVEAPATWTIVSNSPLRAKTKVDGRLSWQFAPSPLMSTYLFAVAAGPWKEWKNDADGTPLALYARQSVAKHVDPAEWFRITKKGLDFFAEFFGVPYPFAKYDQILIPDMNAGAMENIGAVTFSERFIFRGPATEEQRRDRADTILHEMAHMWFGDLVTMRWWNGLWLNESFATYMASLAVERTKLFSGAPQAFFTGMKRWAYSEDQLPTTHPIEVSVPDTAQATANFDGITYGKGAAALKQLHYLLGDEDFQEGLHRYFTRFAYRNTALVDFMNTVGQGADRQLGAWTKDWLQTTGYNTVAVDFACGYDDKLGEKGGLRVTKLDLVQKAPGRGNKMRTHQLLVGLYQKDSKGRISRIGEGYRVTLDSERVAIDEALGKKCPDLIFPNEQDYGYVSVELDPRSLETAKTSLAKFGDPFTRNLLAHTLREMVKAGTWTMEAYAKAALDWLKSETNKTLIEDLSDTLASPSRSSLSAIRVLDGEKRLALQKKLFALAREKAETAGPGTDLQRIWFDLALNSVHDSDSAEFLMKIHDRKAKISGLRLDPDLKWNILAAIAPYLALDSSTLEKAAKEDASSEGQTRLLQVKAGLAETPADLDFPALFSLEKSDPAISNSKLRRAMRNYLPLSNDARVESWRPKFFSSLDKVGKKSDSSYFRSYVRSLFPSLCSAEVASEAEKWVDRNSGAPKVLRIAVAKAAFVEGWCAAMRDGKPYPLWGGEFAGSKLGFAR